MERTWRKLYVGIEKQKKADVLVPLVQSLTAEDLLRTAPFGYTVLHLAAEKGIAEVVSAIISAVPSHALLLTTWDQCTALHLAAEKGHEAATITLAHSLPSEGLLLEDARKRTALHWVAFNGMLSAARELLSLMPPGCLAQTDELGNTPLHCCSSPESISTLLFLASHATEEMLLMRGEKGETILHSAAEGGDVTLVHYILELIPEAALMMQNETGSSPLHLAVLSNPAAVQLLLDVLPHAAYGLLDDSGNTALHLAAADGRLAAVECLLRIMGEADIIVTDSDDRTALHLAAINGHRRTVASIQRKMPEAVITAVDGSGKTAAEYLEGQTSAWVGVSEESRRRMAAQGVEDLSFRLQEMCAAACRDRNFVAEFVEAMGEAGEKFRSLHGKWMAAHRTPTRRVQSTITPEAPRLSTPRSVRPKPRRLSFRPSPSVSPATPCTQLKPMPPAAATPLRGVSRSAVPPPSPSSPLVNQPITPAGTPSPVVRRGRRKRTSATAGILAGLLDASPEVIAISDGESDGDERAMAQAHAMSLSRQIARIANAGVSLPRRRKSIVNSSTQPAKPTPKRRGTSLSRGALQAAETTSTTKRKQSLYKQMAKIAEDPWVIPTKRKRRPVLRTGSQAGAEMNRAAKRRKR